MRKDKQHIRGLKRERTKGAGAKGLPLDKNERVVPFDESILEDLRKHLAKNVWKYPDMDFYYEIFANWLNIDEKKLFFTEGVSGAIRSLMELYATNTVYYNIPTYAMYNVYSDIFQLKRSDMKEADLIFLQNPNIPYGTTYSEKEIRRICTESNKIVALDDVYFGFNIPDYISLVDEYENLIIMRSFSKAFGLASIRLGYIISNEENIKYIYNNRNGYETNLLSLQTAHYFIRNEFIMNDYVEQMNIGRNFLIDELNNMSIKYEGGYCGNFIFIHTNPNNTENFANNGILVRRCEDGIRLTLGPKKEMEAFIAIFRKI